MQSNIRLISALLRGVWFIEEGYAQEQWPLVERMLVGGALGLQPQSARGDVQRDNAQARAEDGPTVYAVAPHASAGSFLASPYRSYDSAPQGAVAVIPARGVIMREDFCGDIGTDTRTQLLLAAGAHPNIAAIVIEINSPGGEASGLATFFDAVRAVNEVKPVLAIVNDGMAASAGYYMAAGAREIYLSHAHGGVGSIGCVLFLTDESEKDKKDGRKRLAVYAPQSTDKNKDFQEALAGKPELLREGMLRAWCGAFIESVQLGRGDRLNPEAGNPLTGKMYYDAAESQALGLVDGVMSFQQVVQRALDLAAAAPAAGTDTPPAAAAGPDDSTSPTFIPVAMAHPRLLALLGLSAALVSTTDGTHLQAAHLDAVEGALDAAHLGAMALSAAQGTAATQAEALTAATARADAAEAKLLTYANVPAAVVAAPAVAADTRTPDAGAAAADEDPILAMVLRNKLELGLPNE